MSPTTIADRERDALQAATDLFADTGALCARHGVLDEALAKLSAALDPELLDRLGSTCWAPDHGPGLPGCRCGGES